MTRPIRLPHVFTDAARIGILTAAVKAAGAAKTVVSARYFGASNELDAYLIAFLIPSFLADVLAGGILQSTMPALLEFREKPEADDFYASVLYASAFTLAIVAILTALASPWLLGLLAAGFPATKLELTHSLLLWMLPIVPLSAFTNTWRMMLNAHERFLVAAFAPILTPLVTIASLLWAGTQWGILALAGATLAGATLECIAVACAIRWAGRAPLPRWRGSFGILRPALRQYLPLVSASLLLSCSTLVDQGFAARLGAGSVSALNLGTRVVSVMLAVGPAALGTAIFPRLSRDAAAGDWTTWRRRLWVYTSIGFLAAIPLTALLIQWSTPIARALFERGAFTSSDTEGVARVQAYAFLQIPFALVLGLLVKAISSVRENHALIRAAAVSLVATVGFDYALVSKFGIPGIPLATVIVQLATVATLLLFLSSQARKRSLGMID